VLPHSLCVEVAPALEKDFEDTFPQGLMTLNNETIEIFVNGSPRNVAAGTTIALLIEAMNLPWRFVAVEKNLELVPRARHAESVLAAGDRLEIVTLVGGG
jgi:sulfur carrier protein